jgi:glycosyltransferase involved in cell wall biosynthesis
MTTRTAPPLITLFTPDIGGGIGRNTVHHANELDRRGFGVDVIIERQVPDYEGQLSTDILLRLAPTTHSLMGVPWMLRYLLQRHPAAMMVSNVRLAMLALRARSLARVPTRIIATVHNTYSLAYARLEPGKLKKRIAKCRKYYPRLDAIVAVSEGVREDFARFADIPTERIRRIYNPIFTEDLTAKAREHPQHPWLSDPTEPVVVSVGRLSEAKNFSLLVSAFELLRAEQPARLIIVGDGPLREALKARIARSPFADAIDLPGFRDNPLAFMSRADLFVMSSNWEGFGNVLAEALACGAPAVATDCPHGPREILEGGRYGRLVPVGDVRALATAMADVLDDPPDAQHQRQGAQRFRLDRSTDDYLNLLDLPHRVPAHALV